jgi:phytol kinase
VGYSRKIFHFGIFTTAAAVHLLGGLGATDAFGAVVAGLVLLAVVAGDGNLLFDALARPADRPRRALFIVVPLITTAVGGLATSLFFGPLAAVGYLVAGWGDAVGEPVGVRWGRHRYPVPSLAGVSATRSWEGTGAVVLVSALAAGVVLVGLGRPPGEVAGLSGAVGLATGLVEAVSPHGMDNLTVPLSAAGVVWILG